MKETSRFLHVLLCYNPLLYIQFGIKFLTVTVEIKIKI